MHSLPPRHTHMYTHTRTHTYTHACTGMSTNTHTHTRMHTIHTRMCTQPQAAEPPLVAACQGRPPTPLRGSQRLQLGGRNPTLLHQPAARLRGRPGGERPPAPGLPAAPNLSAAVRLVFLGRGWGQTWASRGGWGNHGKCAWPREQALLASSLSTHPAAVHTPRRGQMPGASLLAFSSAGRGHRSLRKLEAPPGVRWAPRGSQQPESGWGGCVSWPFSGCRRA